MANRVETQKLIDNNKRALIKYVIIADGSATANSSLISFNELNQAINATGYISNTDPKASYSVAVKRIHGYAKIQNAAGYASLKWINDANSEIVVVGSGSFDFNATGVVGDNAVIPSPAANSKGLCYTTVSPTSGDVYTLFVDLRKDSKDYDAGQSADPAAFNKGNWTL